MENTQLKKEKTLAKWESDVKERLRTALKKFAKPLTDLVTRDANEGDTRLLVTDFLCEGLGYDKYVDLTTEYRVKGEFADYGIRVDQEIVAFIEVKRINIKLSDKHLRQVQSYSLNEGCEWMILTNGAVWQVYHLTGGLPVVTEIALDVDLMSEVSINKKVDQLFYLTKESFRRKQINVLWQARRATSPKSLADILVSDAAIDFLRKEVKKQTNHVVDNKELLVMLKQTVIRPECFDK